MNYLEEKQLTIFDIVPQEEIDNKIEEYVNQLVDTDITTTLESTLFLYVENNQAKVGYTGFMTSGSTTMDLYSGKDFNLCVQNNHIMELDTQVTINDMLDYDYIYDAICQDIEDRFGWQYSEEDIQEFIQRYNLDTMFGTVWFYMQEILDISIEGWYQENYPNEFNSFLECERNIVKDVLIEQINNQLECDFEQDYILRDFNKWLKDNKVKKAGV